MAEHLIVASNRGPVSWQRDDDGNVQAKRGFGGLVTALGGALQSESGTWVSVAMDEDDRMVAREHGGEPFVAEAGDSQFTLRLLDVGDRFEPYYNEVSNRLLWFTVHGLWSAPYEPSGVGWSKDLYEAYVPVNAQVADAVAAATGDAKAEVYLQDYHLCAAPSMVRSQLPDTPVLCYLHTPWATPEELRRLPDAFVEVILDGLLAADVVGFSSPAWASAFRRCATELAGARLDGDTVVREGRRTVVASFTLGVDRDDLESSAASEVAHAAGDDLDAEADGRRLLLRVDRTDLSKNILRGLHAYELLLERHAEHRGRVWHYAHLNPSRQDVPEYRNYLDACQDAAERIRDRFGQECLTMFVGDDYPRAVAALMRYDVLLTTPVRDGTNLVAKEGPTLNRRDGVVVLSPYAGAADVLGEAALTVNPYDVEVQAEALHAALTMDAGERGSRAARMREAALVGSPAEWFGAQRRVLRETRG